MENNVNVYVRVNSLNFWWGIYGLCSLAGWEDIFIYSDSELSHKLGSTCICTKDYLGHALKDLAEDPEEKDFLDQIIRYLDDDKMYYHYYYDRPSDEDFHELVFDNLPLNENGVKPRSLEMWHPSHGIDIEVIGDCVKVFCQTFLNIKVDQVHLVDMMSVENAVTTYKDHLNHFSGQVFFSENLISEMMSKLSRTREEVVALLDKST